MALGRNGINIGLSGRRHGKNRFKVPTGWEAGGVSTNSPCLACSCFLDAVALLAMVEGCAPARALT